MQGRQNNCFERMGENILESELVFGVGRLLFTKLFGTNLQIQVPQQLYQVSSLIGSMKGVSHGPSSSRRMTQKTILSPR
jgi:hypothetical protein